MTTNLSAIINLFKVINHCVGNLELKPQIFPDVPAPVIHMSNSERALSMMRWGMPSPSIALKGKNYDKGQTNVRNTSSSHWRRWLGPANRCLVPFTAFSEFSHAQGGAVWFESESTPIMAFAGIWTNWTSVRKVKEGEVNADIYAFLTCEPNAVVAHIHPKAMPVILAESDWETWLNAPSEEAMKLQRPWPDDGLKIIKRGLDKEDS